MPRERRAPPPTAAPLPPVEQRLNPTGRTLEVYVPLVESERPLGNVLVRITPDDRLSVQYDDVNTALGPALSEETKTALTAARETDGFITVEAAAANGLDLSYNPRRIELAARVASRGRSTGRIPLAELDRPIYGEFESPEAFTAYLNIRGSLDYEHVGSHEGVGDPLFDLDLGSRIGPVAIEALATVDFSDRENGSTFQRRSTALVYDIPSLQLRTRLGDVQTPSASFQDAPLLLGISAEKLYRTFEPQRNIRPRSFDAFNLDRDSEVDVVINGRVARRLVLPAGSYQLDQFPFVGGSNDVQIIATDPTGRQEIASFSRFFDPQLLEVGLSEYGFASGVIATPGRDGLDYDTDDWVASGFYRRGINDFITAGANAQLDNDSQVVGGEAIWATSVGTFGIDAAVSNADFGTGAAVRLNYQLISNGETRFQGLNLAFEIRSVNFGGLQAIEPARDGSAWTAGASTNFRIGQESNANFNISYSKGRGASEDVLDIGAAYAFRWGRLPQFTVSASYRDSDNEDFGNGFGLLLGFSTRFGERSFVSAQADTREEQIEASFNQTSLRQSNSYNINGRVELAEAGIGGSGSVS